MSILKPRFQQFISVFRLASLLAVAAIILVSVLGVPAQAAGKKGGSAIVVFGANWCANCRQITPIVQEIGSQNGLSVDTINVDIQDAPSQASAYGLSIPSADLPQVYLVNNGHVTLLLDGRQYKFVKPDDVRNHVLSTLQQAQGQK